MEEISHARAELIARAHGCVRCGEYSYKRVVVKRASEAHRDELHEVWHATLVCGVCHTHQELGIEAEGDIVYAS